MLNHTERIIEDGSMREAESVAADSGRAQKNSD